MDDLDFTSSFDSSREGMRLLSSPARADVNHCGRIASKGHRVADRNHKRKIFLNYKVCPLIQWLIEGIPCVSQNLEFLSLGWAYYFTDESFGKTS